MATTDVINLNLVIRAHHMSTFYLFGLKLRRTNQNIKGLNYNRSLLLPANAAKLQEGNVFTVVCLWTGDEYLRYHVPSWKGEYVQGWVCPGVAGYSSPTPDMGYNGIWSVSGRYAFYWNAFLCLLPLTGDWLIIRYFTTSKSAISDKYKMRFLRIITIQNFQVRII